MVISLGRVKRISTAEPSFTSLARKKYTPRELTSRDSVLVSPTAAPVVQRTVSGSRMEKRWVVRRSEPVKEVLLIEDKVYLGKAQVTIELRIQKRFNLEKYRCTRTGPENWNQRLRQPFPGGRKRASLGIPLTITKDWPLRPNTVVAPQEPGCVTTDRSAGGESHRAPTRGGRRRRVCRRCCADGS